jgi:PPOX class probable F420-dependent enzyme
MSVIPSSHADLLDKPVFWHVATNGTDGTLHTSPVWAGWDGEHFVFSLTTGRQKYRNLQADPTIAVSSLDPEDPYRYLEIRGRVVRFDDDSTNQFIDSMAKKYKGLDAYPFHQPGDQRVVVVVEPIRAIAMG